jgi:hypothetical protein
MAYQADSRYLALGHRLAQLLGTSLQEPPADALRDLARAYHPAAPESRVSAELFLLYKYLLVQACVGVFPEGDTEQVVAGLFAALNERASGLNLDAERQAAMERMWQLRAGQFDPPFGEDREQFLTNAHSLHWKRTIFRFCQNVHEMADPPDIWAGADGPSQRASRSVTEILDQMLTAVHEVKRWHVGGAL